MMNRSMLTATLAILSSVRTAQAADPVLTDYAWSAGAQPTHMMPSATSFCVLHEIIGSFESQSDLVQIGVASDGTWELYGSGGIQDAKATCVNANAAEVQNGVQTHWLVSPGPGGVASQNLTGDFCFQMAIAGAMGRGSDGLTSHVNTYEMSSGNWVQLAEGDVTTVVSEVGCVNMVPPIGPVVQGQFTDTDGNASPALPTYPNYLCALTTVQKTWNSSQSFGQVVVTPSRGTQFLQTSTTLFGDVGIAAECLLLAPVQ